MINYEIREYFSKYITREMNERNIRPWYVAYYGDTSEAFIRACIKLKKLPRLDSLIMIAELFECTVNDLLGFDPVMIEARDGLFNAGIDSRKVAEYFMDQIALRGFNLDNFQFNEPDMDVEFKRCLRFHRLPDTDAFLQICSALNRTPSDLLGY